MKTTLKLTVLSALSLLTLSLHASQDKACELKIIVTADTHGKWLNGAYMDGKQVRTSFSGISHEVNVIREAAGEENVILLDAGDNLTGDNAAFYCKAVDTESDPLFAKVAGYLEYDAVMHSADDYAAGDVASRTDKALKKNGVAVLESGDCKMVRKNGVKVAVLAFGEEASLESAQKAVDKARKKAQAVVVISHEGIPELKGLKGVDVLAGGYSHRYDVSQEDGMCVMTAGSYCRKIAVATVKIDGDSKEVKGEIADVSSSRTDSEYDRAFASDFEAVKAFTNSKIGVLTEDLDSKECYKGQCSYMNLYHSLALAQPGVDVSLCATLSIGGVIPKGDIIFDDIASTLYPFDNRIVVLAMTGRQIKDYLEAAYDAWVCEDGLILKRSTLKGEEKVNFSASPANFDSAGGLVYTVDITRPCGERVNIQKTASGEDFSLDKTYNCAITSYRASGAGGLLKAAGIDPKNMDDKVVYKGDAFRDLLYFYIKDNPSLPVDDSAVGSWRFIPEDIAEERISGGLKEVFK